LAFVLFTHAGSDDEAFLMFVAKNDLEGLKRENPGLSVVATTADMKRVLEGGDERWRGAIYVKRCVSAAEATRFVASLREVLKDKPSGRAWHVWGRWLFQDDRLRDDKLTCLEEVREALAGEEVEVEAKRRAEEEAKREEEAKAQREAEAKRRAEEAARREKDKAEKDQAKAATILKKAKQLFEAAKAASAKGKHREAGPLFEEAALSFQEAIDAAPKTKEAAEAKRLRNQAVDLELQEKVEVEAARKLKLAKMLWADGAKDNARARFEEIIKMYPNTEAGREAEALLNKLRASGARLAGCAGGRRRKGTAA
jgi:hypothetical protein